MAASERGQRPACNGLVPKKYATHNREICRSENKERESPWQLYSAHLKTLICFYDILFKIKIIYNITKMF